MADNSYKNDLIYVQNELLGDIKNVEKKLELKLKKNNQSFEEYKIALEKKMNYLENAYNILLQKTQNTKNNESFNENKIIHDINSINQKMEGNFFILKNDVNNVRKELRDSNYKYEKLISDNLKIPGLVGYKSKFTNFGEFLQNLYKIYNDLLKSKTQQESDFIKYKEKMNNAFAFNKSQFEIIENKIGKKLELKLDDFSKNNNEKISLLEERINTISIENGKYSSDLLAKCNDLTDKCNKIDDILKNALEEYNDKFITFKNTYKKLNEKMIEIEEKYNSFEEKLKSIKDELLTINTIKRISNINIFENRIKDLEKQYLTIENEIKTYKEKNDKEDYFEKFYRNKSSRRTSKNLLYNLSRNESNSIFEKIEKRKMKKSEINDDKNELELLLSSTNSLKNINNQAIEEKKEIFSKTKNILNNKEISKSHKLSRNSYISNKNKFNNSSSRVISGKIFNRFPFISYIQKKDNANNTLNIKREKFLNKAKDNSKENNNKNKEEKIILGDLKNKKGKESNDKNSTTSYHTNIYLDKKIDFLGKSMVNNYNKIITQINFIKKNFVNDENHKTIKLRDKKGKNNSIKNINNSTIFSSDKNLL